MRRAALILAGCGCGFGMVGLFMSGILRFNYPSTGYPVRGIDVSHHQRQINWSSLPRQGYVFAYIKATEGGDWQDPAFAANWNSAHRAGVVRGAYHFFTFCTPGYSQATNFIGTVGSAYEMLPPVVDVEFHGNCANPPALTQIRAELGVLLARIEARYSLKPMLYVTRRSYERIVKGVFAEYPIWIRDIVCEPDAGWIFWQFADRGWVDGVPTLVDLNVFHGSAEVFRVCATTGVC